MSEPANQFVAKLTDHEQETLLLLVGHMIPSNSEFDMPGADDPQIFSDILRSIDRDRAMLSEALCVVNEIAGGRLADLPRPEQAQRLVDFRGRYPKFTRVLESATARCYYRDDRVMASIGMEVRPSFPLGFVVEQGDWSLLDPVRSRGKIYRNAD